MHLQLLWSNWLYWSEWENPQLLSKNTNLIWDGGEQTTNARILKENASKLTLFTTFIFNRPALCTAFRVPVFIYSPDSLYSCSFKDSWWFPTAASDFRSDPQWVWDLKLDVSSQLLHQVPSTCPERMVRGGVSKCPLTRGRPDTCLRQCWEISSNIITKRENVTWCRKGGKLFDGSTAHQVWLGVVKQKSW